MYKVTADRTRGLLLLRAFHLIDEETEAQKGGLSSPRSHSPWVHRNPGPSAPESGVFYHKLSRESEALTETFLPCAREEGALRRLGPSFGHPRRVSPASFLQQ